MTSHSNSKIPTIPSERDRVAHLVSFHKMEMSWAEKDFLYQQCSWLEGGAHRELSERTLDRVTLLENTYCGQICHALNKAGVKHG